MKKILLCSLLFQSILLSAFSEEGRGSCKINGTTNDYIEVTAYTNGDGKGNYVIANSASKPMMSVYIVIMAEVKKGTLNVYESKTLFRGNYLGKVEPYQSQNVDFTFPKEYKVIRNISVAVSNPTCL